MKRDNIIVNFGIFFLFSLIVFYNLNIDLTSNVVGELKGSAFVDSNPEGAKIYLNSYSLGRENYIGETPKLIKNLDTEKTYELRLEKRGFYDFNTIFFLKEAGENLEIKTNLIEEGYGNLFVDSNVDADVYINGIIKGQTPLTFRLLPGNYKVKLLKEGYGIYELTQSIVEGKEIKLHVNLELEENGEIFINSEPDGAKIFVDKEYRGLTPKLVPLSKGYHDIKLEKDHYKIYEKGVYVNLNKITELNANFVKINNAGFLFIDSIPKGAQVFLDNEFIGNTPLKLEGVEVGDHRIKIVKQGFNQYIVSKHISAGRTTIIEANLEAED